MSRTFADSGAANRSFTAISTGSTLPVAIERKACAFLGVEHRMIKIKARGGEGVEQMLKRFKRLCDKEGLIKDTQRISYYEKPSERRRRRMRKSMARAFSLQGSTR